MIDIFGTLGPSCSSQEVLTQMFHAGMTGIRLNLSHISLRESEKQVEMFHAAAREAGVAPLLLIDMQGPELRIGRLKAPVMLCENETAILYSDQLEESDRQKLRRYSRVAIPVPEAVCASLTNGSAVLLDDGRILLQVTRTGGETVEAKIIRGGMLNTRKSIKVPGVDIELPTMTGADLENIRDAASFGVTGIMQPFVRSLADILEIRRAVSASGNNDLQLIAKIESREGMKQLDVLLPACDALCIARGDLGNDMDLWDLPAAQKIIGAACQNAGKYYMVATQMLSSMIKCAVPTRAEVNDIFNTVADGASGVMITAESAVGSYPVEAIRYLANTARRGEMYRESATSFFNDPEYNLGQYRRYV